MYRISPFVRHFALALLAGIGLATLWVNLSPATYYDFVEWHIAELSLPRLFWGGTITLTPFLVVIDILMALFFFFIGKELWEALTLERFAFDVELLSVALHHQFSIEQVPVEFTQRQADYASSVTMLPASVQMFLDLLRINRNWKSGRYNTPALQARRQGNVHVITDD